MKFNIFLNTLVNKVSVNAHRVNHKARFTYGLVWAAAQGPKTRGAPSSKTIKKNVYKHGVGANTCVMKDPQILLAQWPLKA